MNDEDPEACLRKKGHQGAICERLSRNGPLKPHHLTCYFLAIKVKVGEVDFKHTLADYRNHRLLFQIQFPRLGFVFPVVELMGSC